MSRQFNPAIRLAGWFSAIWLAAAASAYCAPIDDPPIVLPAAEDPPPTQSPPGGDPAAQGNRWARDPRLAHPQVRKAREALQAGQSDACLEHLEAAAADEAMPPVGVLIAYLHLAENRWRPAMQALEQAAIESGEHPEIYLTAGQIALVQGRNLDARLHFEKALAVASPPAWPAAAQQMLAISCQDGLATIAERRHDWAGAAAALGRWAELDGENAALLDRRGKALFLAGKVDEALAVFGKSHALDSSRNPAELSIAALAAKNEGIDAARPWYEKAIEKYPGDGRVYFEYAGALLLAGRTDQAQAQLDKALEVGTHLDDAQADVALIRGMIYRSQKNYEQAEAQFTKVLEVSPGHFPALRQLPLVLVEQQDQAKRERAMQLATFLAKRHRKSPQALATLGWVSFRTGDKAQAEQMLKQATSVSADGEALFFMAQVFVDAGNTEDGKKAVAALEAAIDRPGLFVLREEAREWVKTTALLFE